MARRRNYGTYTPRRKAALRKAQLASARKRRRNSNLRAGAAGAAVGVLAVGALGGAYVLGQRTVSHRNTPGGSPNSTPMGTDKKKKAKDKVDKMISKEKNIQYLDPEAPTSRLDKRGKTPAQQTGGLIDKPKSGGTASAPAKAAQASKSGAAASNIPLAPLINKPKPGNTYYNAKSMTEVLANPQLHDQILGWRIYNDAMKQAAIDRVAQHGFLISPDAKDPMRGGVLYHPLTAGRKAANTRKKKKSGG